MTQMQLFQLDHGGETGTSIAATANFKHSIQHANHKKKPKIRLLENKEHVDTNISNAWLQILPK